MESLETKERLEMVNCSIKVYFSGEYNEEKARRLREMCLNADVNGVMELAKVIRAEFRRILMLEANLRKCHNCRHCHAHRNLPLDRAKDLVAVYIKKYIPKEKQKLPDLYAIRSYETLRKFIEDNMRSYKAALIGEIFNLGYYCDILRAIVVPSMAMSCKYFVGR